MELKKICNSCKNTSLTSLYSLSNFGVSFNIVKCDKCGLTFRDVLLDKEEIEDLYSEKYFNEEQIEYFFSKSEKKNRVLSNKLAIINKARPEKGKIFDIGCAIGTFLQLAKRDSWDASGIEVSKFASDYARTENKLNVITGDLIETSLDSDNYDVITMWDLIEHLENPQAALDKAFQILKKNGLLVIQTTMEDSFLTFITKSIYYLSLKIIKWPLSRVHPVHHATFYDTQTLKNALKISGFEVLEVRPFTMDTELVHTSLPVKIVLRFMSTLANLLNMPYEKIFIARKQ